MELAVAVDGRVVEVALALGEGEQGDQGEGLSSSAGRHLYASGTELCGCRGLPPEFPSVLRPLADYMTKALVHRV